MDHGSWCLCVFADYYIIDHQLMHWELMSSFLIFHSISFWWLVGVNKFFLSTKSLSLHHFWGVERFVDLGWTGCFFYPKIFQLKKKRDPKHVCPRILHSPCCFGVAISLVFPLFEGWPVSLIRFPATMWLSAEKKHKKNWHPGQDGVPGGCLKARVPGGLSYTSRENEDES